MVYLPLVLKAVFAINQIQTYLSISPSYYGAEAWKSYKQVRINFFITGCINSIIGSKCEPVWCTMYNIL